MGHRRCLFSGWTDSGHGWREWFALLEHRDGVPYRFHPSVSKGSLGCILSGWPSACHGELWGQGNHLEHRNEETNLVRPGRSQVGVDRMGMGERNCGITSFLDGGCFILEEPTFFLGLLTGSGTLGTSNWLVHTLTEEKHEQ